jgi:hypothetical protein
MVDAGLVQATGSSRGVTARNSWSYPNLYDPKNRKQINAQNFELFFVQFSMHAAQLQREQQPFEFIRTRNMPSTV